MPNGVDMREALLRATQGPLFETPRVAADCERGARGVVARETTSRGARVAAEVHRGRTTAVPGRLSPQQWRVAEYLIVVHTQPLTGYEATKWNPRQMRLSERIAELRAGGFPVRSVRLADVPGHGHENRKTVAYVLERPLTAAEVDRWLGVGRGAGSGGYA